MKLAEQPAKFAAEDAAYLERRQTFATELGLDTLYEWIDHYPLFAGEQTLGNKLATYELLKQTLEVPGHVLEFGTWKGANLMYMAKVLRLLQPHTGKLVIGFDNFAGLPAATREDGAERPGMVGRYKGDEAVLRKAIETFGYEGYVHLVVGDALQTIPRFAADNPECLVSLAYVDFDLYAPVRAALELLADRLAVGGLIVFDEAVNSLWPGETVAMQEFLAASGMRVEMIANPLSRQPVMALRRLP